MYKTLTGGRNIRHIPHDVKTCFTGGPSSEQLSVYEQPLQDEYDALLAAENAAKKSAKDSNTNKSNATGGTSRLPPGYVCTNRPRTDATKNSRTPSATPTSEAPAEGTKDNAITVGASSLVNHGLCTSIPGKLPIECTCPSHGSAVSTSKPL
jgi:hypothetical protein